MERYHAGLLSLRAGSIPGSAIGRSDIIGSVDMVKIKWGACPKCGKKCIKLREDTVLVNFPMYCKVCKTEYVISWGNVRH